MLQADQVAAWLHTGIAREGIAVNSTDDNQ